MSKARRNWRIMSLNLLLLYGKYFNTSNLWDKIYAVLGMAQDVVTDHRDDGPSSASKLIPDYTENLLSVYREATWTAMSSSRNLGLLPLRFLVGDDSSDTTDDGPSWVPRYKNNMTIDGYLGPAAMTVDLDTMDIQSIRRETNDVNVLLLRGVQVASVVSVIMMLPKSPPFDSFAHYASLWEQEIEWSRSKVLSLALCMINGFYGITRDGNIDPELDLEENRAGLLRDFGAWMLEAKRRCPTRRNNAGLEGILTELDASGGDWMVYERNTAGVDPGSLVQLDNGVIGLAQHVAPGDRMCILFGCESPFTMRWTDGHWRLQGLAYVPGTTKVSLESPDKDTHATSTNRKCINNRASTSNSSWTTAGSKPRRSTSISPRPSKSNCFSRDWTEIHTARLFALPPASLVRCRAQRDGFKCTAAWPGYTISLVYYWQASEITRITNLTSGSPDHAMMSSIHISFESTTLFPGLRITLHL